MPANPRAWLISTGRFKAIDGIRRHTRFEPLPDDMDRLLAADTDDAETWSDENIEDDRLRLIFTCCHPALSPDAQVAMTLARSLRPHDRGGRPRLLSAPPTVAQRIVRAKAKIRNARIPYEMPTATDLPDRLDAVLRVVYLVFNEGYSASSGASPYTRMIFQAKRSASAGCLWSCCRSRKRWDYSALMLLHDSRRAARTSASGRVDPA